MRHVCQVREAARLAHVPVRTIYLWIAEERLTVTGPSRSQKVDLAGVERLRDLRLPSGRLRRVDKET